GRLSPRRPFHSDARKLQARSPRGLRPGSQIDPASGRFECAARNAPVPSDDPARTTGPERGGGGRPERAGVVQSRGRLPGTIQSDGSDLDYRKPRSENCQIPVRQAGHPARDTSFLREHSIAGGAVMIPRLTLHLLAWTFLQGSEIDRLAEQLGHEDGAAR